MGRSTGAAGSASGDKEAVETAANTSDAGADGGIRDAENGEAAAVAAAAAGSSQDDNETARDLSTRSAFAQGAVAAPTRPGAFHAIPIRSSQGRQEQSQGERGGLMSRRSSGEPSELTMPRLSATHTIASAYLVEDEEDGGEGGGRSMQPLEVSHEPVHEAKVVRTLCGGKWEFRFYCFCALAMWIDVIRAVSQEI